MPEEIAVPLFGYGTGTATLSETRAAVQAVWTRVSTDGELRAAAAAALQIPEEGLMEAPEPPVRVAPGKAGTGAVDVAILIVTYIGTDIVWGALRSLAQDEVKRRLKQLWSKVLEPAVRSQLRERDALGEKRDIT